MRMRTPQPVASRSPARALAVRRSRLRPPGCVVVLVATAALGVVAGGCSKAVTPSAAAFCRRVDWNLPSLTGPVTDRSQVDQTVGAYRNVLVVAPAGVRDAWANLADLVEAAGTVDLAVPGARDQIAKRTLAMKPDIDTVVGYTKTNCGLDLRLGGVGSGQPAASTGGGPGEAPADGSVSSPGATPVTEAPGTVPPTVKP